MAVKRQVNAQVQKKLVIVESPTKVESIKSIWEADTI